jgi:hypothetical protein
MGEDRYARWGAAGGIVAVVLFVVGFGLYTSGAPGFDASGNDVAKHFADHATRIQIGLTTIAVGLFFFIWFLGSLRSAIAAAEGGSGRLASIAYGAGLISVAALAVGLTGGATAALRPEEVDPNLTRALNDFGILIGGPAAGAFTALFAATAIAGYRHKALPAPIAGFSALSAITQPFAFGVVFCTTGAFAADGVLGAYVPFATFGIAVLTASWTLYRGYTPPATT